MTPYRLGVNCQEVRISKEELVLWRQVAGTEPLSDWIRPEREQLVAALDEALVALDASRAQAEDWKRQAEVNAQAIFDTAAQLSQKHAQAEALAEALDRVVAVLTTADGLNIPHGEAPKLHARQIADSTLAAYRKGLE